MVLGSNLHSITHDELASTQIPERQPSVSYSKVRAETLRRLLSPKVLVKDPRAFLSALKNLLMGYLPRYARTKPMEVLTYPNPVLSEVCEPVDFDATSQDERSRISTKIAATLLDQMTGQRVGLAAPQIGISKRVFIFNGKVAFNPEFRPVPGQRIEMIEACYSVPGKLYRTSRPKYGWASYRDEFGELHEHKINGIDAVCYQHELAHLDGKCLPDYGVPYDPAH